MTPATLFLRVSMVWILAACAAGLLARTIQKVPPAPAGPPAHPLQTYPAPLYAPWVLPGTSHHGLDFAQIYFPALALRAGDAPYAPETKAFRDPENRVPGYPPFSLLLTLPFLDLGYGGALRVHLVLQAALFCGATLLFLRRTGLQREVPHVLALCAALLFLTPAGLTFLERGQCDLYAATASLLGFTALLDRKKDTWTAAAAGVLAGVKWTAVPLLGALAGTGWLVQRRWFGLPMLLGFAATLLAFPRWLPAFLDTLRHWESQAPDGISADRLWTLLGAPMGTSKLVFVLAGLLLIIALRRSVPESGDRVPVAAMALAVLATGIGSVVWEYRVVALLGTVPVLWRALKNTPSSGPARLTAVVLALYLLAAFRCPPWLWLRTGGQALLHPGAGLGAVAFALLWILKRPEAGGAATDPDEPIRLKPGQQPGDSANEP